MFLHQADGTAWMALYSVVMLNISLELAVNDAAYEDMAIKFLEHFTSIADAINQMSDGFGLWDPEDGFYYDHFHREDDFFPLRVRSVVGLIPLMACLVLDGKYLDKLPGFRRQLNWFMENRKNLAGQVCRCWYLFLIINHVHLVPQQRGEGTVLGRSFLLKVHNQTDKSRLRKFIPHG